MGFSLFGRNKMNISISIVGPPYGRLSVCAGDGILWLGLQLLLSEQEMHSQGTK